MAQTILRVADLPQNRPAPFRIEPDAEARAALTEQLDILDIRKLRFEGEVRAEGRDDYRLEGMLGATVVQACVVTLDPVVTRIDTPVSRRYMAHLPDPEPGETEMPEDDTIEPLGRVIDLMAVAGEALSLALPPYPRSPEADFDGQAAAPPGTEPIEDDDLKPFAGLKDVLKSGDKGE